MWVPEKRQGMRRRALIATAGTGIAALTAGCFDTNDDDDQTGLPPASASTNQEDEQDIDGAPLQVSGTGSVSAEPNQAVFQVSVEETGDEAEAVSEAVAERIETVRDALTDAGLDDDEIETANYRLGQPHRNPGYEATHSLAVTVDDVDRVGELVDTAVGAGADEVGRINFTIDDETREGLREQALGRAIDDAREEAEVVAQAQGMEITGIIETAVSDSGVSPYRVQYSAARAEMDDGGARTEIDGGEVNVRASVTVTYALE